MAAPEKQKLYYCEKCGRTMTGDQFYTSNNLKKYPNDGKLNQCKKCLTMHVNNWDPETFMSILEDIDIPWVPAEWNTLLRRYGQNRAEVTGTTILGRYISKMRLKQYKDYRWKDTEFLQELANHTIEETMKRQGYSAAEIAEAIQKGYAPAPLEPEPEPEEEVDSSPAPWAGIGAQAAELTAEEIGLTDEDVAYLRLKWGNLYKPEEWVKLEQLYNDMMESYDIQTAGHIDTLKLICKTSLKANQLIDIGDVEGYQKMQKAYDSLMRSGKFTAAQNKAESGEYVDSISELVLICERDGFIPRYYVETPEDHIDLILQDLQTYTRNLVTEEMGLGNMIENAVKQIEQDREKEESDGELAEDEYADLFKDEEGVLTTEDYEEFNNFQENDVNEDLEVDDDGTTGPTEPEL